MKTKNDETKTTKWKIEEDKEIFKKFYKIAKNELKRTKINLKNSLDEKAFVIIQSVKNDEDFTSLKIKLDFFDYKIDFYEKKIVILEASLKKYKEAVGRIMKFLENGCDIYNPKEAKEAANY